MLLRYYPSNMLQYYIFVLNHVIANSLLFISLIFQTEMYRYS